MERRRQGPGGCSLWQRRLRVVRRLPRTAGAGRHRRRPHRHSRSLACDHDDRRLPSGQGCLSAEARNSHPPRRPAHGRRCPSLRSRRLRRQPACDGRLQVDRPALLGRRDRRDQVGGYQRGRPVTGLLSARPANTARHRLGPVAGAGAMGAIQLWPLRRQLRHRRQQLAVLCRLFRWQPHRLGSPPLWRHHLRDRSAPVAA